MPDAARQTTGSEEFERQSPLWSRQWDLEHLFCFAGRAVFRHISAKTPNSSRATIEFRRLGRSFSAECNAERVTTTPAASLTASAPEPSVSSDAALRRTGDWKTALATGPTNRSNLTITPVTARTTGSGS